MDMWELLKDGGLLVVGIVLGWAGHFVQQRAQFQGKLKVDALEADRAFYRRILSLLPTDSSPVVLFTKHNFASSIHRGASAPIFEVGELLQAPDSIFLLPEMKKIFKPFVDDFLAFRYKLGELIYPKTEEWSTCVRGDCDPDHFIPPEVEKELRDISALADRLANSYANFVLKGKKILSI